MLLRSLGAALAATATLLVTATAGPAVADDGRLDHHGARVATDAAKVRAAATSRRAARVADDATPLQVTIETLSPSTIPRKGKVRLTGTVTNTDSVPWLTVNVYSFISDDPMRTKAQLAAAVKVDESEFVGGRITDFGNYDTIDEIAPGESKQFTFTVDVALLQADTAGVYWFGVHALGQRSGEGRDEEFLADGRARTFYPKVPADRGGDEDVSVVIPLRREMSYADDGSLADLDDWVTTLSDGGRLRSLVELAATAGDRSLTWVVDPALVDAVRQLAAGNPPRSLAANLEEGQQDEPPESPSASGSPSDGSSPADDASSEPTDEASGEDPTTADLADDLDPETLAAAQAARDWLGRLRAAMDGNDEVLTLPYGDMDVSAAARHHRIPLLDEARARSSAGVRGVDVETSGVIAPPSGYLSAEGIRAATGDETVIVGDRLFPDPPSVATVAGRRVVVTSSGAADGGPAPGDPRGIIAMRQRILAEAAIRFLNPTRPPLVVLLPYDWVPAASTSFFSGLDAEWLRLSPVRDATAGIAGDQVSTADLRYPQRQTDYELDAANFDSSVALQEAGASLDSMLTLNDVVGRTVSDQALTATSYGARGRPDSSRASTDRSRVWIEQRLGEVEVSAPGAVTLSSINGSFPATIVNKLDEKVTVSLSARSTDEKLTIDAPTEVEIAAKQRSTVLLDARTDTPGVHDVTIRVTDAEGHPLGGSDELSIRSARVSNIIWLFLATGVGLLFGTIGFRLVRRVRAARGAATDG